MSSFDLSYFKTIPFIKQRLLYARQHLSKLGAGSSRVVFALNDTHVLKVAKNRYGLLQCLEESKTFHGLKNLGPSSILADISDNCSKGLFVIMELCSKVKAIDFYKTYGISFENLSTFAEISYHEREGINFKTSDAVFNDFYDNFQNELLKEHQYNFLYSLQFTIHHTTLNYADFSKLDSWCKALDGSLKLIDYGLTKQTSEIYETCDQRQLDHYLNTINT